MVARTHLQQLKSNLEGKHWRIDLNPSNSSKLVLPLTETGSWDPVSTTIMVWYTLTVTISSGQPLTLWLHSCLSPTQHRAGHTQTAAAGRHNSIKHAQCYTKQMTYLKPFIFTPESNVTQFIKYAHKYHIYGIEKITVYHWTFVRPSISFVRQ